MIRFFRYKLVVYLLVSGLFLGFGLKTAISISNKIYCMVVSAEDDQVLEEGKSDKEKKSGRITKKMPFAEFADLEHPALKNERAFEAHNRVYLLLMSSEPLIAILTEPPEA